MTDGGGTRRPLARPCRTASSHDTATATGSSRPSAGRNRRPEPARATLALDGAGATSAGSTLAVIDTRDITGSRNATAAVVPGARPRLPRPRLPRPSLAHPSLAHPEPMTSVGRSGPGPAPAEAPAMTPLPSVRFRHVTIVDEGVDRLLHVHARRDDARLLQSEAGLQDRVALRRPDLVVRELGALLELLVDDRVGELRSCDEDALLLVVIGERILARLLVDREHAAHDVGMILQELFARIEDAPGIGLLVAVEQLGAVGDLGLRHHRVEPRPGVDVATDESGLAVRMLQQHGGDVLLGQPHRLQRTHQEDVRIGAAGHCHP